MTGVWLFAANDRYFPGSLRRTQAAVVALQGHVTYAFRNRIWVAGNGTWFTGGEARVAGVLSPDEQRNTRLGATLSIPMGQSQSLKVTWSTGTHTLRGTDFDSYSIYWELVRF